MQTPNETLRTHITSMVELSNKEWDYVWPHFQFKKFKKHSVIIQTGDAVKQEYFVLKGLIKTFSIDDEGKEHILQFAMENWWVSDYFAFNYQSESSFMIQCLEDTEVLALSYTDRMKLCDKLHVYERFCRMKTTTGFLSQQKRIMALLQNNAQSRYLQLTEQYPSLLQRVPKVMIAAYLGVTRETLSRLKAESK